MHTGPPIIRAAADGCQLLAAAQLRGSNYAPRNVGKIERAREEEEEATSPTSLVKGKGAGRAPRSSFPAGTTRSHLHPTLRLIGRNARFAN